MKVLIILNDPPYGTERSYNALRFAQALVAREGTELRLFLTGDSVGCAMAGQVTPQGYYKLDTMLRYFARKRTAIGCCGTCLDARGITDGMLVEGSHRSSQEELAEWTEWADKVVTF